MEMDAGTAKHQIRTVWSSVTEDHRLKVSWAEILTVLLILPCP